LKHYFCSCCNKEFNRHSEFFSIRDGKRLFLLHGECIPVFSSGVGLGEIEEKCGVVIKNKVDIMCDGAICWSDLKTYNFHREDGPAVTEPNGDKYWWLDGYNYSEEEYAIEMKKRRNILLTSKTRT